MGCIDLGGLLAGLGLRSPCPGFGVHLLEPLDFQSREDSVPVATFLPSSLVSTEESRISIDIGFYEPEVLPASAVRRCLPSHNMSPVACLYYRKSRITTTGTPESLDPLLIQVGICFDDPYLPGATWREGPVCPSCDVSSIGCLQGRECDIITTATKGLPIRRIAAYEYPDKQCCQNTSIPQYMLLFH